MFSGSALALPSSVTETPSATLWSAPASAVGASLTPAVTATSTVSAREYTRPSFTTREKVSVAFWASCPGALKVGFCAVEELRVTVGEPPVWLHA